MADSGFVKSSKINYRQLTSSFFSSPRLFSTFVSSNSCDTESTMTSPTSILDTKPFSSFKNPFSPDSNTPKSPKPESKKLWEKLDSGGVGLALIDTLIDEKPDSNLGKPDSRMVLFGSQLKIQVPPLPSSILLSPNGSPKSPCDFGIKTRSSPVRKSPVGSFNSARLSASEMELSEDYTCVISYGPNPRTTHIFDDCIVESCCGVVKFSESRKENVFSSDRAMSYPSESFLSFCYSCKKNLGQGTDIYMYRGEKAFCSSDCRYREMKLEGDAEDEEVGTETSDLDGVYCSCS